MSKKILSSLKNWTKELNWANKTRFIPRKRHPRPKKVRSSRPEVLYKKGSLKNFAKLTEKHLCWSLFPNKVADCIKKRDAGVDNEVGRYQIHLKIKTSVTLFVKHLVSISFSSIISLQRSKPFSHFLIFLQRERYWLHICTEKVWRFYWEFSGQQTLRRQSHCCHCWQKLPEFLTFHCHVLLESSGWLVNVVW